MSKLSQIKERETDYEKKLSKYERELTRSKQKIYNMKRYISIYDIKKRGSKKKKKKINKKTKNNNKKCRKCRCKPCKCDEDIHCYQIMTSERYKRSKKYKKFNEKGTPKYNKRKSKRSRKR
jgi:hypothetical protein